MIEIVSIDEWDESPHKRTNNNFAKNKAPLISIMPKHGVINFQKPTELLAGIDTTKWIKFFRMKLVSSEVIYAFVVLDNEEPNSYQIKLYKSNAMRIHAKVLGREILSELNIKYVNDIGTVKFLATPCDENGKKFKTVRIGNKDYDMYFLFYCEYIVGNNWDKEHVINSVSRSSAIRVQSMLNYYEKK